MYLMKEKKYLKNNTNGTSKDNWRIGGIPKIVLWAFPK